MFVLACHPERTITTAVIPTGATQNDRHPDRRRRTFPPQPGSPTSELARWGGQWRDPRISSLPVLCRCLFLLSSLRVFRARRTPANSVPPQPSTPFFHKSSAFAVVCSLPYHPPTSSSRPEWRDPRIFFPQKPQQFPLSSPSNPKNPPNQLQLNHFPQKNSWHSSYAPLDTINIWIEFTGQREPFPTAPSTRQIRFITGTLDVK